MGRSTGPRSPSRPCGAACSGAGAESRRHSESFRDIRDVPGHSESFRVVPRKEEARSGAGNGRRVDRVRAAGVYDAASPSRSDLLLARAHPARTARNGTEWHGMARNCRIRNGMARKDSERAGRRARALGEEVAAQGPELDARARPSGPALPGPGRACLAQYDSE